MGATPTWFETLWSSNVEVMDFLITFVNEKTKTFKLKIVLKFGCVLGVLGKLSVS
jgi:hypothetical protein